MDNLVEKKNTKLRAALLLIALGLGGGGAYWVNSQYDVRVVRRATAPTNLPNIQEPADAQSQDAGGQASKAATDKPAPIVIRLACVDAEAALRRVKTPRSLRDQLRGSDQTAPKPIPGKRCRPVAANLAGGQ